MPNSPPLFLILPEFRKSIRYVKYELNYYVQYHSNFSKAMIMRVEVSNENQ